MPQWLIFLLLILVPAFGWAAQPLRAARPSLGAAKASSYQVAQAAEAATLAGLAAMVRSDVVVEVVAAERRAAPEALAAMGSWS